MLKILVLFLCSLTFLHAQNFENSSNFQKIKLSHAVPARKAAILVSNISYWIPKDSVIEVLDINNEFLEVKYANEFLFVPISQFEGNEVKIYIEQKKIEEKKILRQKEESVRAWETYKIKNSIHTPTSRKSNKNIHQSSSSNRISASKNSSSKSSSDGCYSTRCTSYTKKGNRCLRMTTNCSGRCWQH